MTWGESLRPETGQRRPAGLGDTPDGLDFILSVMGSHWRAI